MLSVIRRVTRTNILLIAIFALVVLGVSTFALLWEDARLTGRTVIATRLTIESLANQYHQAGIPLPQAAREISNQIETEPQVSFAIFDDKGKLLAGDAALSAQGKQAAAMLKVMPFMHPPLAGLPKGTLPPQPPPGMRYRSITRALDVRVASEDVGPNAHFGLSHHFESISHFFGGGSAVVVGNVGLVPSGVWRYSAFIALLGLIATLLGSYLTKRQAQHALAPVASVSAALRRLAAGDFSRFTPTAEESHDAGELFSAYNSAAATTAAAVDDRQRLEANMRQFVADAGHELRTPLTVIMGYIDVLHRGAIAEQALARRILDTMRDEGERMRALITKLLSLARMENTELRSEQRLDVAALARKVIDAVRPIANGSTLDLDAAAPVYALADEAELREALNNIVDNALKYAPGSRVRTSVVSSDGQAVISIRDDGAGMSEDERAHAFERFFRGSNRDIPGSGLGLAIAKRSVERAHGTITLDSTPGKGTVVTIRLPAAAKPSPG